MTRAQAAFHPADSVRPLGTAPHLAAAGRRSHHPRRQDAQWQQRGPGAPADTCPLGAATQPFPGVTGAPTADFSSLPGWRPTHRLSEPGCSAGPPRTLGARRTQPAARTTRRGRGHLRPGGDGNDLLYTRRPGDPGPEAEHGQRAPGPVPPASARPPARGPGAPAARGRGGGAGTRRPARGDACGAGDGGLYLGPRGARSSSSGSRSSSASPRAGTGTAAARAPRVRRRSASTPTLPARAAPRRRVPGANVPGADSGRRPPGGCSP